MFRNKAIHTFALLAATAWLTAIGTGCKPEALSDDIRDRAENINTILSINMPYISQTDGLPEERQIDIVDLFFVPLTADGSEQPSSGVVNINFAGSLAQRTETGLKHTVSARIDPGSYHLYIAANLTANQRAHILQNGPSSPYTAENATLNSSDFCNTISDFAHYRDFRPGEHLDENSELTNIVMFGIGLNEELERQFQIEENTTGAPTIPVICNELQRVVSKVHLTAEAQGDYIPLSGALLLPDGSQKGWIKLSDLQYMVNCANKKLLFQPYTADDQGQADPNYLVSESLRYSASQYIVNYDYVRENFAYHSIEMLREHQHRSLRHAEKYDAARVPGENSLNEYTQGLYCLENTFSYDYTTIGAYFTPEEEKIIPLNFTTHLLIASMFTPRYLVATTGEIDTYNTTSDANLSQYRNQGGVIEANQTTGEGWDLMDDINGLNLVSFANEKQAQNFMTFCLDYRNQLNEEDAFSTNTVLATSSTYDAQSFFVYRSGGSFYSIGAAYALLNHYQNRYTPEGYYLTEESFTAFNHGWCYYHTYIDGQGRHVGDTEVAFSESMIYRNHYYILRLNSIATLGSVQTPVFIQTHTICEEWDDTGGEGLGVAE